MKHIDPRTDRPFGDHGSAQDAIDYVLSNETEFAPGEARDFLKNWQHGDLDEWGEYYQWLRKEGR